MDGRVGAVARRDDVMAQICEQVRAADPHGADAFARSYYAQLGDDDLASWTTSELSQAALEHWRLGSRRAPNEALVRVYTPAHGHTAVDVVIDDMPFLVDSLTMALDRRNLGVHLVVHPILSVRRSPAGELLETAPDRDSGAPVPGTANGDAFTHESWTHIEIDRETNTDALDSVRVELLSVLHDVRAATRDWQPMLEALQHAAAEIEAIAPPCDPDELVEGKALLAWLADQNFTFLGYRAYALTGDDQLLPVAGSGLGLLRAAPEEPSSSFAALPASIRAKAREKTLLVLTKANRRSTVHRPTHLDYVGIKRYDERGAVVGEHRFIGLYASGAYTSSPFDVPVLRRKVAGIVERAGFLPREPRPEGSHADPRDLPARRPVPDRRRGTLRDRDGNPAAPGAAQGSALRPPRGVRALHLVPRLHTPRPLHHPGARTHRALSRRRLSGQGLRVEHSTLGVGARPAALRAPRRRARR